MSRAKSSPPITEVTRHNVETIANLQRKAENCRNRGERVADAVAATVGSWPFIIAQSIVFVAWMALNLAGWFYQWDPYPFILLNLVLSFQAAFASPIIMMSQNRQAKLDARRNQLDLQINLLAEQENTEQLRLLRLLCEKADIPLGAPKEQALEEPTKPDEIIRQITECIENSNDRQ